MGGIFLLGTVGLTLMVVLVLWVVVLFLVVVVVVLVVVLVIVVVVVVVVVLLLLVWGKAVPLSPPQPSILTSGQSPSVVQAFGEPVKVIWIRFSVDI